MRVDETLRAKVKHLVWAGRPFSKAVAALAAAGFHRAEIPRASPLTRQALAGHRKLHAEWEAPVAFTFRGGDRELEGVRFLYGYAVLLPPAGRDVLATGHVDCAARSQVRPPVVFYGCLAVGLPHMQWASPLADIGMPSSPDELVIGMSQLEFVWSGQPFSLGLSVLSNPTFHFCFDTPGPPKV